MTDQPERPTRHLGHVTDPPEGSFSIPPNRDTGKERLWKRVMVGTIVVLVAIIGVAFWPLSYRQDPQNTIAVTPTPPVIVPPAVPSPPAQLTKKSPDTPVPPTPPSRPLTPTAAPEYASAKEVAALRDEVEKLRKQIAQPPKSTAATVTTKSATQRRVATIKQQPKRFTFTAIADVTPSQAELLAKFPPPKRSKKP